MLKKFCKDCKHVDPHPSIHRDHVRCLHPKAGWSEEAHPVDGYSEGVQYYLARVFRDRAHGCGPEAKLFEPK